MTECLSLNQFCKTILIEYAGQDNYGERSLSQPQCVSPPSKRRPHWSRRPGLQPRRRTAKAKLNEAEAVKSMPDDTAVINQPRQYIGVAMPADPPLTRRIRPRLNLATSLRK